MKDTYEIPMGKISLFTSAILVAELNRDDK